jgi:hypothetical protein
MKFTLEIGDKEKTKIQFSRNWFTGSMKILADGKRVAHQSPFDGGTHFHAGLKRRYEFEVGTTEKHKVVLEKERPLLMAGGRAQTYCVFVDDKLVHEQSGY